MFNQKEVIDTLRIESKSDPVVNAVLTMFGARERARDRVTLHALTQRMKDEGFVYDQASYIKVLKLLAKLGLGKLDIDPAGRVRALREVKVTLQSIGQAAVGQESSIQEWNQRNKFREIPVIEAAPVKKPEPLTVKERVQPRPAPGVWEVLCVPLDNGSTYKTYMPAGLTVEDAKRIGIALAGMVKQKS